MAAENVVVLNQDACFAQHHCHRVAFPFECALDDAVDLADIAIDAAMNRAAMCSTVQTSAIRWVASHYVSIGRKR